MSQPEPGAGRPGSLQEEEECADDVLRSVCFSQPIHPDHMLLGSQIQATPGSSQVGSSSFYMILVFSLKFHTKKNFQITVFIRVPTAQGKQGKWQKKSLSGKTGNSEILPRHREFGLLKL